MNSRQPFLAGCPSIVCAWIRFGNAPQHAAREFRTYCTSSQRPSDILPPSRDILPPSRAALLSKRGGVCGAYVERGVLKSILKSTDTCFVVLHCFQTVAVLEIGPGANPLIDCHGRRHRQNHGAAPSKVS